MKKVNHWFLSKFLAPIGGLADDNAATEKYKDVDPNDQKQIKQIIRSLIKPSFERRNNAQQEKMKLSLSYYLTNSKIDFERVFESDLPPFDPPSDPRDFFVWIWEELFPGEDYRLEDIDSYVEVNDIDEPLGIRRQPDGSYKKIEDD